MDPDKGKADIGQEGRLGPVCAKDPKAGLRKGWGQECDQLPLAWGSGGLPSRWADSCPPHPQGSCLPLKRLPGQAPNSSAVKRETLRPLP